MPSGYWEKSFPGRENSESMFPSIEHAWVVQGIAEAGMSGAE